MDLHTLVGKSADGDFLRDMIGFAAQRRMELEVGGLTGAAYGEKDAEQRSFAAATWNGSKVPRSGLSLYELDPIPAAQPSIFTA